MNAQEIRIGNWYDHNGVHRQVTPNTIEEVWEAKRTWCKPIPLTEEWHNNFGVKKDGFGSFVYKIPRKNNSNIKVIFSRDYVMLRQGKGRIDDDLIAIWNKDIKKRDMFVHEWQNLYFSLCGEELMIKE
jgi:hypothetical protein